MFFKKKIYPEAYIKLFLETVYNLYEEQDEFCEDGFSADDLIIINDITYYISLVFALYSLRINFWNSEKLFCTFFQAFEMILKQKDFNDNYIDQECRKLFAQVKEVEAYLETQNSSSDIGLNLYMFCNNKIRSACEINIQTDANFIAKSASISSYTKQKLKQITFINDNILRSYSLRKD